MVEASYTTMSAVNHSPDSLTPCRRLRQFLQNRPGPIVHSTSLQEDEDALAWRMVKEARLKVKEPSSSPARPNAAEASPLPPPSPTSTKSKLKKALADKVDAIRTVVLNPQFQPLS